MFGCVILFLCELLFMCVCIRLSTSVCAASVRKPLMFERQKLSLKKCDFQCSVVWHCFCVSVFICVCVFYMVLLAVSLFVQRLCVNHWCASGKNWGKKLWFSMFGCLPLFLCELVYVCVYVLLSVSVCTASVRQPLFDRQKLRLKNAIFNVRLCGIVFVRACLCVCVCFTLYYYLSLCLYSVCVSTIDVRAAKTEVKKCDFQCSVVWCCFGVSLFMCVCITVYVCLCRVCA